MNSSNNILNTPALDTPTTDTKDNNDDVLYIGIDLGTSRTSIAASNGVRETVASYVGYVKDFMGRKKFGGRETLYGDEAIANRLAVELHRPLAEGVIKTDEVNQQAVADLIEHIISLAQPRPGQKIFAVIGAPSQASIHNKQAILDAARKYVDSVMITSEPFNVAYGMNIYDAALIVDIGAGTTDLCRMHGSMPNADDQITINFAGDSIDKSLETALQKDFPQAQFSIYKVKEIKQKYGFVGKTAERIKVRFPVKGKPDTFDITEHMRQSCKTVISPIVDVIYELIGSFDPDFQQVLRENVVLAGGGSQIMGLAKEIELALEELGGGKVIAVEEPIYAGTNGALKLAQDMPVDYWLQLS
ncbi:MAG: rod shape-determining protein [Planctomycetes bacterium]|nr:rod shape-determining protein [Planctomycetota bacterium]